MMPVNMLYEHVHEGLVLGARSGYPIPFGVMTGLWGILVCRREMEAHCNATKKNLPWIISLFNSFFVYPFGGAIFVDLLVLGRAPMVLRSDDILFAFLINWFLVWYCPKDIIGKFLTQTPVFLIVEACMILDWATGSLNLMEYIAASSNGAHAPVFWFTIFFTFVPPLIQYLVRVYLYGNFKADLTVPHVCYIIFGQQIVYWATMLLPCMGQGARCHSNNLHIYVYVVYGTFLAYLGLAYKMLKEYKASRGRKSGSGSKSRSASVEKKKK